MSKKQEEIKVGDYVDIVIRAKVVEINSRQSILPRYTLETPYVSKTTYASDSEVTKSKFQDK